MDFLTFLYLVNRRNSKQRCVIGDAPVNVRVLPPSPPLTPDEQAAPFQLVALMVFVVLMVGVGALLYEYIADLTASRPKSFMVSLDVDGDETFITMPRSTDRWKLVVFVVAENDVGVATPSGRLVAYASKRSVKTYSYVPDGRPFRVHGHITMLRIEGAFGTWGLAPASPIVRSAEWVVKP